MMLCTILYLFQLFLLQVEVQLLAVLHAAVAPLVVVVECVAVVLGFEPAPVVVVVLAYARLVLGVEWALEEAPVVVVLLYHHLLQRNGKQFTLYLATLNTQHQIPSQT